MVQGSGAECMICRNSGGFFKGEEEEQKEEEKETEERATRCTSTQGTLAAGNDRGFHVT